VSRSVPAMPNRRDMIRMTDAEVTAFLGEERVLNVATIGPTGHPHLVAMWFALLDGRPAFWTFAKSQKIQNLRRDDRITALVEAGDAYPELRGVEVVGRGRIVEDLTEVLAIGSAVARRYAGGLELGDAGIAMLEKQAAKRLGVVIEVERVVSWDHRKLAAGTY
jgi:nitroimidazol reductase NimA-like FMN-containing flavoprotein (pyridoxamine 5'-phosphate oxidase superfamily)